MEQVAHPKPLVIVGTGETAELAYEYFTHDSDREVVAFTVDRAYKQADELFGLPVVAFEELEAHYPPDRFDAFVAISYTNLNRVRTRLYDATKAKGYRLASYISSRAFVWRNVELGDNCFVMEMNVLQYGVKVGNNVTFWSGNHIGHQTTIGSNTFISSHVVISGYCNVGQSCFIGVNTAVHNNINIGDDCLIGAAATIAKHVPPKSIIKGPSTRPEEIDTHAFFAKKNIVL